MDQAKLDDYLRKAQEFIDSGEIDEWEDFKLDVIEQLKQAREAVLAGAVGWDSLVRKGLRNKLIRWPQQQAITDWIQHRPDDALQAFQDLWANDDTPPEERIRLFVEQVPDHEYFQGVGTRLVPVSVLLLTFGTEVAPFRARPFNRAYKQTDYGNPPSGADEGKTYEHAMGFLDRLLERREALGFERPRDRLDAQSIVWWRWAIRNRPKNGPPPPVIDDPDDEDPLLDALATELLLEPRSYLSGTVWPLLEDKKQIIFQGPPGTGKTFVAREMAKRLSEDPKRVRIVQFHPSYAYEDFVQGFRPTPEGDGVAFRLKDGPLLEMAKQAREEPDELHFLVIDEINRGNLGKILGELYFLLEYRKERMHLQYSDTEFLMPENLYIIGTMNTADRSIALVDLALRRRFHFVEFHPDREPIKGLLGRWLDKEAPDMKWIADLVDAANERLGEQRREAAIGPTYFMRPGLDETRARRIWEHNVLPYVEEQLYGESATLTEIKALWRDGVAEQGDTGGATPDSSDA